MAVQGDVRIVWDTLGFRGDIAMDGPDLESGHDLETAVLISLFTDQRAPDNFVLTDGSNDRRGWWADTYETDQIGSRLWTFFRAKKLDRTLNDLRDCVRQALQWMIDDGVASSIDIDASWYNQTAAALGILIHQPNRPSAKLSFVWSME